MDYFLLNTACSEIYLIVWLLITGFGKSDIKTYYMTDYCHSKLNMASEKIDQLKLVLNDDNTHNHRPHNTNNYEYTCEMKIEAWYNSYNKIMFYFEDLIIDCKKGHLEFYVIQESDKRVKGLENNICGSVKPEGVFTVETRFLKIKYSSPKHRRLSHTFTLILTTYRDDTCPNYSYECDNARCIDRDLLCNGYNSCGDNSSCHLGTGVIIGIISASIVSIVSVVALLVYCTYRHRQKLRNITSGVNEQNENQMSAFHLGISERIDRTNQNFEPGNQFELPPSYNDTYNNIRPPSRTTHPIIGDNMQPYSSQSSPSQNNINDDTDPPSYSDLFETDSSVRLYHNKRQCQNANSNLS